MTSFEPVEDERKALDYVTDYMKKIRRGDLVVNSEMAQRIMPINVHAPRFSLGGLMAEALSDYRETDDYDDAVLYVKAARKWIEQAWDQGVISEGKGVIGKLDDCEGEREKIKNELTELSNKFTKLDDENKNLKSEVERLREILYQKKGQTK